MPVIPDVPATRKTVADALSNLNVRIYDPSRMRPCLLVEDIELLADLLLKVTEELDKALDR